MKTVIIDYGSGNLRSCAKAFERAAQESNAVGAIEVSASPAALSQASHIVLPGVGAFNDCMQGLKNVPGLLEALHEQVMHKKKWFLGICVGMQLMLSKGFEHGEHQGLGWIEGEVVKLGGSCQMTGDKNSCHLPPVTHQLKIPHMGWNELVIRSPSPLLKNIKSGAHAYFVHSYHAKCKQPSDVLATTDYGGEITAAIGKSNLFGTQFHPEKSQETGLRLIANFLAM